MPARIDMTDQRFGRLVVKSYSCYEKVGAFWNCVCDCGAELEVSRNALVTGKTQSCGCFRKEASSERSTTHGMRKTPTYNTWCRMKDRCNNKNNEHYDRYGGRGISYDPTWDSFEKFLADMGERPVGMSLDRKDN